MSKRVHRLDVPTLILHGTNDKADPIVNGKLLAERVEQSQFERIEAGSHLFMIEDSERVNEYLRDFLGDV